MCHAHALLPAEEDTLHPPFLIIATPELPTGAAEGTEPLPPPLFHAAPLPSPRKIKRKGFLFLFNFFSFDFILTITVFIHWIFGFHISSVRHTSKLELLLNANFKLVLRDVYPLGHCLLLMFQWGKKKEDGFC